jgi:protein-S-isoprenylcysteine O-methyltransferase Ste14
LALGGYAKSIVVKHKGTLLISSQVKNPSWEGRSSNFLSAASIAWLSRRRIAISLIGFTGLVFYNVCILQTIPHHPLDTRHPVVAGALILLILGMGLRSWSAGTLNKSRVLTTVGPYCLIRNPLYVGSFMMMLGFCLLSRDWLTLAFVCGPLVLVYWSQVLLEEERLARLFASQWPAYVQATPRFVPRRLDRRMWAGWSPAEWLRNREYKAIVTAGLGLLAVWIWAVLRSAA